VQLRGLTRRFGATPILRGLDLTVAAGETLALFGPNGAGKTTLLRTLAGLLRANEGEARVFGTALPGGARLRRRLGYLGHESSLYRDLSPHENLRYYARLYGIEDPDRPQAMLARVGLERFADRRVATFSRGMLQRLGLARALLHEPDLLLLDEPLTGLDPSGGELLAQLLAEQRSRGATVLMATHDLERALASATRAVIVSRGRIAWDSGPALPDVATMALRYSQAMAGT